LILFVFFANLFNMKKIFFLFFILFSCVNQYIYSQDNDLPHPQSISKSDPPNVFRIDITRSSYTDETVVYFFADAFDYFESYDSEKMFDADANIPQTYTLTTDNVIVCMNGLLNLVSGTEKIVPLGFKTSVSGTNTYTFTAINLSTFDATISVYLEDLQENAMLDLRSSNTYVFTSGVVNDAARFRLHFITPTSIKLMTWTGSISSEWAEPMNWSTLSVPTSSDNVYISSKASHQPEIMNDFSSPALCNDLNIYSSASLTVDATKALTVSGTFINNGTFIVESDISGTGSFIDNENISGSGTFTVKKYLEDNRWWYVGSPMSNATAGSFGTLSNTPNDGIRLFTWNEATGLYNAAITNGADALPPLTGYAYKNFDVGSPVTALFTGTLNSGEIGAADNLGKDGSGDLAGFNLVCNPYASAIDIEVFGPASSNLQNTIWYRSGSTYPSYNWFTNLGTLTGQRYVPAMQAFWVKVATDPGTLIIDNSSRLHNDQAFYKTFADSNVFRMEVSRDAMVDEAVVAYYTAASDAFDAYDSEKMFSSDQNYPQVYTLTSDNVIVAINGIPEISAGEERILPLGFTTYIAGTFTLHATTMMDFDPTIPVFLEDILQSTTQDLRINDTYTFTSGIVNGADRFLLHFGSTTTSVSADHSPMTNAYVYGNAIYVYTPESGYSIEIYDMLGNLISDTQSIKGLNVMQLNASEGVYIIKVQCSSKITTEKVIIK
jgi:hypothetical protein